MKYDDEAADEQHRRLEIGVPLSTVVIQAKIWIVEGIEIIRPRRRRRSASGREAVVNMWWAQTPKPMKHDQDLGHRDEREGSIRARAKVGMIEVAIPNAGSTMM